MYKVLVEYSIYIVDISYRELLWEWFTIIDSYRVAAIQTPQTQFRFTQVRFPNSRYPFLRLLVRKAEAVPQSLTATIPYTGTYTGHYQNYPIATQQRTENSAQKQTVLKTLSLPQPVPLSRLYLPVTDGFDYYRPLTLEVLTDSIETPAGWRFHYSPLFRGTLNAIDRQAFEWPLTYARMLQLTIENGDSPPLHFGPATVAGPVHELLVRFTEPATYFLVWGNARAQKPAYDLEQFPQRVPAVAPFLNPAGRVVFLGKTNKVAAVLLPRFRTGS